MLQLCPLLHTLCDFTCLNAERMEKEAEEERLRKQSAAAERAFLDGVAKAKLVLRRVPLGTDRNHNRYVHTHTHRVGSIVTP